MRTIISSCEIRVYTIKLLHIITSLYKIGTNKLFSKYQRMISTLTYNTETIIV